MMKLTSIKRAFLAGVMAVTLIGSSLTAFADETLQPIKESTNEEVTFPVSQTWNTNGVDVDTTANYVITVVDDEYNDGSATISPTAFTLKGDKAEQEIKITAQHAGVFSYELRQVIESKDGYTYDDTVYTIRDYVKNDGKGGLTTTVMVLNNKTGKKVTSVAFNNVFTPGHSNDKTAGDPPVRKYVEGKPAEASTFEFEMVPTDSSYPLPAQPRVSLTTADFAQTGGEHEIGDITFTKVGTYVYEVKELAGDITGYTYDETVYTVTYTVTTDENDQFVVTREITMDGEVVENCDFYNTYKPSGKNEPDREHHDGGGTGSLMVYKVDAASDNTRIAGVKFEVTKTNGDYVTTITTDSKGMAAIDSLAAGTYRLKEMNTPDGYQSENRYVYVNVLKDTTVASPTNVKVTNTKATTVQHIVAIKQWANVAGVTTPDSVTFTLKKDGVDTGVTQVASAANNWTVDFGLLPADGNYEIVETNVPEDYAVSIEKAVNGTDVVYTITNTYTATESGAAGDHRNGYTGDSSNMALYAGVMAVAAIALAGWFKTTRRSR